MNGWMDGWMNECIYKWVDRSMKTFLSYLGSGNVLESGNEYD